MIILQSLGAPQAVDILARILVSLGFLRICVPLKDDNTINDNDDTNKNHNISHNNNNDNDCKSSYNMNNHNFNIDED